MIARATRVRDHKNGASHHSLTVAPALALVAQQVEELHDSP